MWVIRRTDQGGGFLRDAPAPKTGHIWTNDLRNAKTFWSEEAARNHCCPDNEVPVRVDHLLRTPGR